MIEQRRCALGRWCIALAVTVTAAPGLTGTAALADTTSWTNGHLAGGCGAFITADTADNLYLDDSNSGFVEKFTSGGGPLGTVGPRGGLVNGVAASSDGGVYIAQGNGGSTITKYDVAGNQVETIVLPFGSGNGQAGYVLGIGVDSANDVYVLDDQSDSFGGANRVEELSAGGAYLNQWGSTGDGGGQFDFFRTQGHIAVAGDGTVYVADADNRIQKFAPGGGFVRSWGSSGSGPGQFEQIAGLAVDGAGHLYAGDAGPSGRQDGLGLQEFDSSGTFLASSHMRWGQVMAVTTYGDDLVYAYSCTTVFRLELSIPDLSLASTTMLDAGQAMTATATASVPFGAIAGYTFNFGDGTPTVPTSTPSATHTYAAAGTYTVTVGAVSARGGAATVSKAIVVEPPPRPGRVSPPEIRGTPVQGATLTEVHGTWTMPPILGYRYQWERCDRRAANCRTISGATAATYTLATTDVDHRIRVQETATNAGGDGTSAVSAPTAAIAASPRLTILTITPRAFRAARTGPTVTASPNLGTRIRFTLDVSARVRFTVERIVNGRQAGRRCVPTSSQNQARHRCVTYLPLRGSFTINGKPGINTPRFTGRLNHKSLLPGRYRITAAASSSARTAAPQRATFTILA